MDLIPFFDIKDSAFESYLEEAFLISLGYENPENAHNFIC